LSIFVLISIFNTFAGTDELCRQLSASSGATDEYTRHSVHVTQPYTDTTGHDHLAPRQN